MKNKIRMIGMDLDGTLLKTNKELTAYTKDVLKRAAEQGIIVMPATGRPFSGIPKELTGLQAAEKERPPGHRSRRQMAP